MTSTMKTLDTLCSITFFTYVGVFSRMTLASLSALFTVQLLPNDVHSFFLANILGSFIMGFVVPFSPMFPPKYYSWYVGVGTGYCGSCTTFSTWQRVAADMAVSGQIFDMLIMSVETFCTSYMALMLGMHIGDWVHTKYAKFDEQYFQPSTDSNTFSFEISDDAGASSLRRSVCQSRLMFTATALLTAGLWIGVILDTTKKYRQQWWVAAAFGPIGSLMRYALILYNRNWPTFPLFTFLINVLASVAGTVILVAYQRLIADDENYHKREVYDLWINFGVGAGVLGCFSTVSTFVNELHKLANANIFHAYRYGLLSICVAQLLCISIAATKFFKN